ncbi:MAG: TIGR01777 family oxidoreductase [Cyclonatronaceae bacterium]
MKIFMTGGTGFIGSHLTRMLADRDDTVVIASRNPEKKSPVSDNVQYVSLKGNLAEYMEGCDLVVNLAGESIYGKRWTKQVKKRIRESRIQTTLKLVDTMRILDKKPDTFISASAVHYYGDCGAEKVTEERGPGSGFLSEVCQDWEAVSREAESLGIRVVNPRTGVALGTEGGALATMLPVFRGFIGGSIGSGSQFFPWIHVEDLCRSMIFAAGNRELAGPFNATAPNPVTMDEFAETLGDILSRPSFFRAPEFGLKLALGEAATMVTDSLRIIPSKLAENGFVFNYQELGEALKHLLQE